MNILFIGDIVGKPGRKAVGLLLPDLRKEVAADIVIANVENLAHGSGITKTTLEEIHTAGVDAYTAGNHVWTKPEILDIMADSSIPLVRPANFPGDTPGVGARMVQVGTRSLLIVNLLGRVFMDQQVDDPFRALDAILKEFSHAKPDAILVDFHAEVTSEKVAFGFYADGRVAAAVGTHTHIGTADARILPKGTAYITDIGMTGPRESVLGVDKDVIIKNFLTQRPVRHEIPESGTQIFNSVLIEIDPITHLSTRIERIDRTVDL